MILKKPRRVPPWVIPMLIDRQIASSFSYSNLHWIYIGPDLVFRLSPFPFSDFVYFSLVVQQEVLNTIAEFILFCSSIVEFEAFCTMHNHAFSYSFMAIFKILYLQNHENTNKRTRKCRHMHETKHTNRLEMIMIK